MLPWKLSTLPVRVPERPRDGDSYLYEFASKSHYDDVAAPCGADGGHPVSFSLKNAPEICGPALDTRWPAPCHIGTSKMSHTFLTTIGVLLSAAALATAQTLPSDGVFFHLRSTDSALRAHIEEGRNASPTFRALVDRLVGSDVVVYLRCDPWGPSHVAGRMTFVSTAGGYRYIVVRLKPQPSGRHMLALLAHELQHAVEVVETPAIIDSTSLAREYVRLGYVRRLGSSSVAFDTEAAVDAGHRVLAEVSPSRRRRTAAVAMAERSAGTELAP